MTTPKRVQQRRTKGWRKPDGATSVTRWSKWANPFIIGEAGIPDAKTESSSTACSYASPATR